MATSPVNQGSPAPGQPKVDPVKLPPPPTKDGASSIKPHTDAPTTKSESNCFIVIKNQIIRFFKWICSLCSSKSTKAVKDEARANLDKLMNDLNASPEAVEKILADPNISPKARAYGQTVLEIVKTRCSGGVMVKLAPERYQGPVRDDDAAMLYLFDISQILEIIAGDGSASTQSGLQLNQEIILRIKEHMKHKALKAPNAEERALVIKMIKELKSDKRFTLFRGIPIYKELLQFMNKVRTRDGLPEIRISGLSEEDLIATVQRLLAEPNESQGQREVLHGYIDSLEMTSALKSRYITPVSDEETAMRYLFHFWQMIDSIKSSSDPQQKGVDLAWILQRRTSVKKYMEAHEVPSTLKEEERTSVTERIKQRTDEGALELFKRIPIYEGLSNFIDKVRAEPPKKGSVEERIAMREQGMKEAMKLQLEEICEKDLTLKDPEKLSKVRQNVEAVCNVMLCASTASLKMKKSIQKEEDAILFLLHLNKIIAPFIELQPVIEKEPNADELEKAGRTARKALPKMQKAITEEPPQSISKEDLVSITKVLRNPTGKNGGELLMRLINDSPMKGDLLTFIEAIKQRKDPEPAVV